MKRQTLQKIIHIFMNILADVEFSGVEHVPAQGGVIIATNHLSRYDIAVLYIMPSRSDTTALVADKYKKSPFFNWLAVSSEGIWIDRSKADFVAFRDTVAALKSGRAVGISPEGTRSQTGQLLEGKSGVVLLALRAGVPVVPVGISETDKVVSNIKRLRRSHLYARFGPAYTPPPMPSEDRDAYLKAQTDEIMCRIAALLPEKYHGFYRGHPRIQELISGIA